MKKRNWNKIGSIVLVTFCVLLIIWSLYKRSALRKDFIVMNGAKAEGLQGSGKYHAGSYFIEYTFTLNHQIITGSDICPYNVLSADNYRKHISGRNFPVVYQRSDPSNSIILITPKDFNAFGYNYPDSLQWVLQYINEDK